jgi:hypothetical protein
MYIVQHDYNMNMTTWLFILWMTYAIENSNIDVGWLFVGKIDLEQENALFKRSTKCKTTLPKFKDC